MPEQSPNIVLAPEAPKLTPLDSQNYKDYQAQRKIIGFLGSNDPRVLDMDFYPITRVQKVDFSEGIMEGRYEAPQLRDMLESIEAPLSGGVVQENYTDLAARIEGFGDIERRLFDFIGKDGADHLTPGDMARFLIKYPTPFDVDDYVEYALSQAQNESGMDGRIRLEEALKIFFDGVYGDQFKYWQNFKILAVEAFKENEPREVSKVVVKKRLGANATVAAATAIAVSGFAGGMLGGSLISKGSDSYPDQPNTASLSQGENNTPKPTVQLAPEVTLTPSPEPTPEPTPQPTPETERAKLQAEIEQKYGIELLNQREGYERAIKDYNENDESTLGDAPVLRWNIEQLKAINELVSYVPANMIKMKSGRPLAISLWDYGNEEEASGKAHWHGGDMVTFYENAFTSADKEGQLSLFSHELLHMNDDEDLEVAVRNVLGDKSFFNNYIFQSKEKFSSYNKDNFDAMNTLGSFKEGEHPEEGRAGFAQLYVRGYERFMKAFGPGLDGGDFDPDISREELAARYPKAQEIYDLYKEIFKGKEYDDIARELNSDFKYKDLGDGKVIVYPEDQQIDDQELSLPEIEEVYGVNVAERDNHDEWIGLDTLNDLNVTLKNIPAEFLMPGADDEGNEQKLRILFGDSTELKGANMLIIERNPNDQSAMIAEVGGYLASRSPKYEEIKKMAQELFGDDVKKDKLDFVLRKSIENFISSNGSTGFFYQESSLFLDYLSISPPGNGNKWTDKIYYFISDQVFDGKEYIHDVYDVEKDAFRFKTDADTTY